MTHHQRVARSFQELHLGQRSAWSDSPGTNMYIRFFDSDIEPHGALEGKGLTQSLVRNEGSGWKSNQLQCSCESWINGLYWTAPCHSIKQEQNARQK